MAKRKRDATDGAVAGKAVKSRKEQPEASASGSTSKPASQTTPEGTKIDSNGAPTNGVSNQTITVQIITGSYERVLHGFTASIPATLLAKSHDQDAPSSGPAIFFADTFLFNAHASSIRCLALSSISDDSPKVMLATGSTDERINLYSLSTVPPPPPSKSKPQLPTLHGSTIASNPKNKELGSLMHHSSSVTQLSFPSRSKLLSASEDNTIAITRTRDWTQLSTIKAPNPKAPNRPSGDTAAPGDVPRGINSFAIHPSMKLMVSVGRGERSMRLWNLVTGKKAGVLNFGRPVLDAVGEGRFGSGEGRRVVWDADEGDEFVVGFERGCVVFGIDSKPRGKLVPQPRTKVHEVKYLPKSILSGALEGKNICAVSTEDGRVLFYDTGVFDESPAAPTASEEPDKKNKKDDIVIPACRLLAQLGGPGAGITNRVKDFDILELPNTPGFAHDSPKQFLIVTASSTGAVHIWTLSSSEFTAKKQKDSAEENDNQGPQAGFTAAKQVGNLIGTYSTGTRITCMKAFVMTGKADEAEEEEELVQGEEDHSSSEDSDSE